MQQAHHAYTHQATSRSSSMARYTDLSTHRRIELHTDLPCCMQHHTKHHWFLEVFFFFKGALSRSPVLCARDLSGARRADPHARRPTRDRSRGLPVAGQLACCKAKTRRCKAKLHSGKMWNPGWSPVRRAGCFHLGCFAFKFESTSSCDSSVQI